MVYSNNLYPAKPAFKSNKESCDASFYTANKKAAYSFCNYSSCYPYKLTIGKNYDQMYLLGNSRLAKKNICKPSFNKNDLNINLFTKMNLQNVCVINNNSTNQCASSIDPSKCFYLNYTIDPSGVLFGNTECGINNFENFLEPNPPSSL